MKQKNVKQKILTIQFLLIPFYLLFEDFSIGSGDLEAITQCLSTNKVKTFSKKSNERAEEMAFVNELLTKWPSYDQMTLFAEDVYRQVQERFEYEFNLVAKSHTAPDLIRFERVDSADGTSFEIHLTMYPAGFVIRIEEALGYKAALIGRIIESIDAFEKERHISD